MNDHKDSTAASAGSPSEKDDTQKVVMNQVPPPPQEDVGPVRIAADGVDHHQIQEVEQRATPPSSNEEQKNFPNVISQLASLVDKEKDPSMREQAELLAALLDPGPPIL